MLRERWQRLVRGQATLLLQARQLPVHVQPTLPHLQEGPLVGKEGLWLDPLPESSRRAGQAAGRLLLLLLHHLQRSCSSSAPHPASQMDAWLCLKTARCAHDYMCRLQPRRSSH